MLKVLKVDIKRVLLSKEIYLSIFGICMINLLNIWDELRLIGDLKNTSVFYFFIYRHGLGAFSILDNVVIVLPYALSHAEEFSTGYIKSVYLRIGSVKYTLSKIIVTSIMTFVTVFVGYTFLIMLLNCVMPLFPEAQNIQTYYGQTSLFLLAEKQTPLFFICELIQESTASAFLSVITVVVSLYIKNKYVLLCVPVVIVEGWSYLCGTFNLPNILWWNLFISDQLIAVSANEYINWSVTIMYFLVGIIICGVIFSQIIKKEVEYV